MTRLEQIVAVISKIDNIRITSPFEQNGEVISGSVEASLNSVSLTFKVLIKTAYPLQFHGSETIQFYNEELNEYDHVMKNGLICIHTAHSPDLAEKLNFDFSSLMEWIKRFYIGKESEIHYEHIVVPYGSNDYYLFTDVEHEFEKDTHGLFKYSRLSKSTLSGQDSVTYIVQQFDVYEKKVSCKWSSKYQSLSTETGVYVFIDEPPVKKRKFAIENWLEFESILTQTFLGFLYKFQKQKGGKNSFSLLIGYRISQSEIHWQAIVIKPNESPTSGEKLPGTKEYLGRLKNKSINWAQTKNSSYKYFFGRGSLNQAITESNILIIGVGAIGSIIGESLVRGGCKKVTVTDHDRKEPENVCRSQYVFKTGVIMKIQELAESLTSISPYVEVETIEVLMDAAKIFIDHHKHSETLQKLLNQYDIIFDCSTDDDVAYVLERYKVRAQVFNLSITNHAKELVCVTSPNLYEWLKTIIKKFSTEVPDLYNPTGCWDPTFKASHNDIAVLAQFAVKHINSVYEKGLSVRNFYLSSSFDSSFNIKLTQF